MGIDLWGYTLLLKGKAGEEQKGNGQRGKGEQWASASKTKASGYDLIVELTAKQDVGLWGIHTHCNMHREL
jgi:hypothetical protein